jgi:hypothetical protein
MTSDVKYMAPEKVTTTITLPKETADELKVAAKRAGIGWTQMMAVLIRRGLDEDRARSS